MLMTHVIGISISKGNLDLQKSHMALLQSQNIGLQEIEDQYILYYKPAPYPKNKKTICHLKGLLTRIRSDDIYNAYNDDFGEHILTPEARIRPLIKIKMNIKQ